MTSLYFDTNVLYYVQNSRLFGKQDVDLRLKDLNNGMTAEAPSPPPPPIISSPEGQTPRKDDSLGWSKFKQTLTPSPSVERSPAFPRSSRHDRLGRSSGKNLLSPENSCVSIEH